MATTTGRHVGIGTLIFGPILLVALFWTAFHFPALWALIALVIAWAILTDRL